MSRTFGGRLYGRQVLAEPNLIRVLAVHRLGQNVQERALLIRRLRQVQLREQAVTQMNEGGRTLTRMTKTDSAVYKAELGCVESREAGLRSADLCGAFCEVGKLFPHQNYQVEFFASIET